MKKILALLCLFIAIPCFASDETWITENHDGKVILTPEYIVVISDFDVVDTQLWLPGTDVVITDSGDIINTDDGERAEIQAINYR